MNPRTECACQPVAFMRSVPVAPPERFSRPRNLAVLLPKRAGLAVLGDLADFRPLLVFLARAAFTADLRWDGATWRTCPATRGLLAGVGSPDGALASAFSGTSFILLSPWAVITATTTSIARVSANCKRNHRRIRLPRGSVAHARARSQVRPEDGTGDRSPAFPQKCRRSGPRGGNRRQHAFAMDEATGV